MEHVTMLDSERVSPQPHFDLIEMGEFTTASHKISGPRLNIKTVLSTYGDFHVKDKTAVRTSYL